MRKTLFRPIPSPQEDCPSCIDGLKLQFAFRSDSSCGFELWRALENEALGIKLEHGVTTRVGHLQIHYPCDGILPIRIFASLPEPYRLPKTENLEELRTAISTFEFKFKTLCITAMQHCKIPIDLHYRAVIQLGGHEISVASDEFRGQYEMEGGFIEIDD